jgi:F0F1-type ATP synthase assembly protein I
MSADRSHPEDELRQREQELRERELSLRMRELEAELEQKKRAAEESKQNAQASQKGSRKGSKLVQWINLVGFFLLGLAVVILAIRFRFLIIFFVIFGLLGFIAYKLFWDNKD